MTNVSPNLVKTELPRRIVRESVEAHVELQTFTTYTGIFKDTKGGVWIDRDTEDPSQQLHPQYDICVMKAKGLPKPPTDYLFILSFYQVNRCWHGNSNVRIPFIQRCG